MRSRTDSRSSKATPVTLEKHFKEIVVGSGRSQEPYIIAFHYASDNVSGSPLGTLFGFFEVDIHDQDAAYIVNFLASVAKKEYFANSHRSPVESFEVALHKINVALAEIVKHGNVSWLGHLHGAIGTISQNTLHFSVTGDGQLYLAREEALRLMSDGLADTDTEPHPLKTFTEVSSGELFDADIVFAFSPSVWSLFSPDDLRRSLNRLGPAGFEQFLRTALINELPIAAVTLVTCSAPTILQSEEAPKESQKPAVSLSNVWSGKPFDEALQKRKSPDTPKQKPDIIETPREEYTDQKTGHIYLQASAEETFEENESPWKERWELFSHTFGAKTRNWGIALRKITRRISKVGSLTLASLGQQTGRLSRSLNRRTRSLKRALEENRQRKRQEKEQIARLKAVEEATRPNIEPEPVPEEEVVVRPVASLIVPSPSSEPVPPKETTPQSSERVRRFFTREPRQEMTFGNEARQRLTRWSARIVASKSVLLPALGNIRAVSKNLALRINQALQSLIHYGRTQWDNGSVKYRWIFSVGGVIVLGILAYLIWPSTETPPVETVTPAPSQEAPAAPVFPPAEEPLATLLAGSRLIFPTNNSRSIALVNINDTPFLITERSIVNLQTQESTTAPETIRHATAMDDLDAIFTVGESGSLSLWSTVTKKFEKNTLPLPAGAQVSAIGSYLTYLYVLDREAGIIHRFPRAEGGFGPATTWSKESVATGEETSFAVHENILLGDVSGQPALYSRGKNTHVGFTGPIAPLALDQLAFDTRSGDVLALDRINKRIIRWSVTGTLLAQYFHTSFNEVEAFAVSPDGTELLVSHQGATTAWRTQ